MKKLEFVAIALVMLFMLVAVLGKVKVDILSRSGDTGLEANTATQFGDILER